MTHTRQKLGASGEEAAVRYLLENGYSIIDRNFRTRLGEIDIVAETRTKRGFPGGAAPSSEIVFIEVKTRTPSGMSLSFGPPQLAVNSRKRNKLIKVALQYMKIRDIRDRDIRFDVLAITGGRIEHIENAFNADSCKYRF
ncbi:MAG: YraN family protein [Elusimicrobia bacterium]|nr:YraN family protein [Elusimicrobiota bacterium]